MMLQTAFRDLILDGELFDVIINGLTSAIPLPLVALLVFGSIGVSYYLVQQRIIIPLVMLSIVGGVTISRAPPGYGSAILGVIIISLAGLVYTLMQRVSTQ
jgi:hypothetical protein